NLFMPISHFANERNGFLFLVKLYRAAVAQNSPGSDDHSAGHRNTGYKGCDGTPGEFGSDIGSDLAFFRERQQIRKGVHPAGRGVKKLGHYTVLLDRVHTDRNKRKREQKNDPLVLTKYGLP